MTINIFHYGELVFTGPIRCAIPFVQDLPHDSREYSVQTPCGELRWLDSGELVDAESLIALDNSDTDGPFLGRADGADAIAQLIGDSVRYPYYCHVYGEMTFPEYQEMLADGEAYAAEYAAMYPRE